MLFRFSLYGFLKNLRLFEAFLLLAMLDRGLDFAAFGGLIAVREVTVWLFEVPSGAMADALGRKRCMVASMAAYVLSNVLLGLAGSWWLLAFGMMLYGIGDAFRSGTHKAMILTWLRQHDRLDERTKVYGFTRSWSKLGSALSALLGGAFLVAGTGYPAMFLASAVLAAVNLVNLATYPASLDGERSTERGALRATWQRLAQGLREVAMGRRLRSLVPLGALALASYDVAKDYLQPVLKVMALGWAVSLGLSLGEDQKTGIVVGVVSAVVYLLGSLASRKAHVFERLLGGTDRAANVVIWTMVGSYALLAAFASLAWSWALVPIFLLLSVLQNVWRPVQLARIDDATSEVHQATVLSVESQFGALFAAILAPVLGALVDALAAGAEPTPLVALLPLGLLALPLLALQAIAAPRTTESVDEG